MYSRVFSHHIAVALNMYKLPSGTCVSTLPPHFRYALHVCHTVVCPVLDHIFIKDCRRYIIHEDNLRFYLLVRIYN